MHGYLLRKLARLRMQQLADARGPSTPQARLQKLIATTGVGDEGPLYHGLQASAMGSHFPPAMHLPWCM